MKHMFAKQTSITLQILVIGFISVLCSFVTGKQNLPDTTVFLGITDHEEHSGVHKKIPSIKHDYSIPQSQNSGHMSSKPLEVVRHTGMHHGAVYLGEHTLSDIAHLQYPDSKVASSRNIRKDTFTTNFSNLNVDEKFVYIAEAGQKGNDGAAFYVGEHFIEGELLPKIGQPEEKIITSHTNSAIIKEPISIFEQKPIDYQEQKYAIGVHVEETHKISTLQAANKLEMNSQFPIVVDKYITNTHTRPPQREISDFPQLNGGFESNLDQKFILETISSRIQNEPRSLFNSENIGVQRGKIPELEIITYEANNTNQKSYKQRFMSEEINRSRPRKDSSSLSNRKHPYETVKSDTSKHKPNVRNGVFDNQARLEVRTETPTQANRWKPLNRHRRPADFKLQSEYPQVHEVIRRVERDTGIKPKVFHIKPGMSKREIQNLLKFIDKIDKEPEATNRMGFIPNGEDKGFFSHLLKSVWPNNRRRKKFKDFSKSGSSSIPQDVGLMEILNKLDLSRQHHYPGWFGPYGYGRHSSRNQHRGYSKGSSSSKESSESSQNESAEAGDNNQDDNRNNGNVLSSVAVYTYTPRTQLDRGRNPIKSYGSYGRRSNNDQVAQTPAVVVLDSNSNRHHDSLDPRYLFGFFKDLLVHRYYPRRLRKRKNKKKYSKSLLGLFLLAPFIKIPLVISILSLLPGAIPFFTGKRRKRSVTSGQMQYNMDYENINCLQRILCQSLEQLPNEELSFMERIMRRNPEIAENTFVNEVVVQEHKNKCRKFYCEPFELLN